MAVLADEAAAVGMPSCLTCSTDAVFSFFDSGNHRVE